LLVLFILQIFDCMDIGTSFESKHVDVLRFFDKKIEELNLFLAKKVVNEIEFQIHVHQLELEVWFAHLYLINFGSIG
jgi:hypothetical protein